MNLTDLSVIRSLLGQEQTAFKKKFGQNFLTSPAIVEKIADAPACAPARPLALAGAGDGTDCADPQKTDFAPADPETMGILEIGPGIGVLTDALARRIGGWSPWRSIPTWSPFWDARWKGLTTSR